MSDLPIPRALIGNFIERGDFMKAKKRLGSDSLCCFETSRKVRTFTRRYKSPFEIRIKDFAK